MFLDFGVGAAAFSAAKGALPKGLLKEPSPGDLHEAWLMAIIGQDFARRDVALPLRLVLMTMEADVSKLRVSTLREALFFIRALTLAERRKLPSAAPRLDSAN